jgi:uncharacterized BrkB/YihY/UPF0761 family membrane protein
MINSSPPPKKNLKWIYAVLFITGVLIVALIIILQNPKLTLEVRGIEITRRQMLMLITTMGIFIAFMGCIAFPKADSNGKRRTAIGIVIVGSAIVITSLLLQH